MALHYLSGDDSEMGKSSKKAAKKAARKEKHAEKKAERKAKPKKKRVAKIGLAPARNSFLAVTDLNLLKTATKLARTWKEAGGKERLTKWWKGLGGNPDKLAKAIAKGSKETVSGSEMGVAVAATIALATPILIAAAKIFKEMKTGGDAKEQAEFDQGINDGKKTLKDDPDVDKGDVDMGDKDVAKLKKGDTTNGALGTNAGSICFLIPMSLMTFHFSNPILLFFSSFLMLYCIVGWFVIPFSEVGIAGEKVKSITHNYFSIPVKMFFTVTNFISNGFKRK